VSEELEEKEVTFSRISAHLPRMLFLSIFFSMFRWFLTQKYKMYFDEFPSKWNSRERTLKPF